MTRMLMIVSLSALGIAAACSDEVAGEAARAYPMCSYDFEATVRSGPHTGLALQGKLDLVDLSELEPGGLFGLLVPTSDPEAGVYVSGSAVGGELELDFWLRDGTRIRGRGPKQESIAACSRNVEGTLLGPSDGDTGDWLGTSLQPNLACTNVCNCYVNATQYCNEYCEFVGGLIGADRELCRAECRNDPPNLRCRCHSFYINNNGNITGACE